MATLMIPLILIIVGIGGVLLIVGRKLPVIRKAREEAREARASLESSDAPFAPRQATLTPPHRARIVSRTVRAVGRRFSHLLRLGGRSVAQARMSSVPVVRVFLRVFQRRPAAERIPQLVTRADSVLQDSMEPQRPVVPTTSDIKPMTNSRPTGKGPGAEDRDPLRIPQPLPAAHLQQELPQEETPLSANRLADSNLTAAETPVLDISTVTSPVASLPQESGDTPRVQEEPSHLDERAKAPITQSRPHRRRVVGRVRQRPLRVDVAPSLTTIPAESVDLPVSPIPLSKQKVTGGELATPSEDTETIAALIENGKLGRAESLLIDLLSKNPRDTNAYRMLGIIYVKREEYPQAREVFEEALRRDPEQLAIYGLLGLTYFSLGEYGKALSMYQRAHDGDETNIEYLEKLLTISSRMDRRPLMKVTAKRILVLDPDHQLAKSILERAIAH